jgi:hypothetical protein
VDLYNGYAGVEPTTVAKSNEWYFRNAQETWFEENLLLTYVFFENNVDEDLFSKVIERYGNYPVSQRGGPLFFSLMTAMLMSQSERAALAMRKRLEGLNLQTLKGESVPRAVSLIRATIKYLTVINKRPDDMIDMLLKIFQTSSISNFNEHFAHMERQRLLNTSMARASGLPVQDFTVEVLLSAAEDLYTQYVRTEDWLRVKHATTSTFVTCWNCGDDHTLSDCKKERNDNAPYLYDHKTKRWNKETTTKQGNVAATTDSGPTQQATQQTNLATSTGNATQQQRVLLANFKNEMNKMAEMMAAQFTNNA